MYILVKIPNTSTRAILQMNRTMLPFLPLSEYKIRFSQLPARYLNLSPCRAKIYFLEMKLNLFNILGWDWMIGDFIELKHKFFSGTIPFNFSSCLTKRGIQHTYSTCTNGTEGHHKNLNYLKTAVLAGLMVHASRIL